MHARRDRAGDEQHVRVSGRGDDSEPEALQVVIRRGDERELMLAPVARARIDMADGEAASAGRSFERDIPSQAAEVAKQRQHQRSTQA